MSASASTMHEFDLSHPLPTGRTVLEASAGTGKTYSLTGLIVRYIVEAGVPAEQFLVVTFTRAAANELRDRTRATLDVAARTLEAGVPPVTHPWMSTLVDAGVIELAERRRRVVDAISRFDELTITTIHGFCQQALGQLGVRSGNNPDAVLVDSINDVVAEVCRDEIITTLADDPTALNSPSGASRVTNPAQAEAELKRAIGALMNNPGVAIVPDAEIDTLATRWVELTTAARETVVQRQAGRGEIGYDTLISGMHDALTDARTGNAVAAQLAQRYAVVLVDEFQDTDRVQWDVFDRAFSTRTLITVGDPKQAIYRFRGADVHAYLDAVESASNTLGLAVNFRSDQALLSGLATIFDGATLGDPRIPFVPVRAHDDAPFTAFARDGEAAPKPAVQLRIVPLDDRLRTKVTKEMAMPAVRSLVLADLVERIIDLLDHGRLLDADATGTETGTDPVDAADGWRIVRPGDIAVLVPSHAEANNVAEALRRARIPAVRTRTGSVLTTPAATQWRLLLAALAQPHQVAVVRAAALGWFLSTDVAALVTDDTMLAALQMRAADLGDRLRAVGVSAFYDEQKAGPLVVGVLAHEGGERHLTDLDHISELLAEAMQGRSSDPAQVLRVLDDLIAEADERTEAAMRRIDSDALAVQITTIHSAKGLEYPIVMLPFGFKPRANLSSPYSYTASDGRRTIDFASKVAWDAGPEVPGDETTRQNQEMRRHLAGLDIEGDELRLLYVALTRAKHRLEIWWASTQKANTSALGRVLLDRFIAAEVQNTQATLSVKSKGKGFSVDKPAFHELADDKALAQIQAVAEHSDGAIEATLIPAEIAPAVWGGRRGRPNAPLTLAALNGRRPILDRRWQRWSFSRLGSVFEAEAISSLDPVDHEAPVDGRGGFDEPADAFGELAAVDDAIPPASQLQLGIGPVAHLADVAGGTRFGTFVHSVLEQLAFNSPTLAADIRALVLDGAAREGLDLGVDAPLDSTLGSTLDNVVAGLVAAVRTPLGPLFGGRALADFDPRDRLPELTFDMPIAGSTGTMTAGTIGEILLANLGRTDPIRPFAASLAGEFARFDISGWMNGSIDGVFRVPVGGSVGDQVGTGEHRYVIVDYKTNRLHQLGAADPVAAYHPTLLVPAMEHSRYPLQALLYSIALHRYLRWRLGSAYDPDKHLGGTTYLFVRGMVGPDTPVVRGVAHGVFSWHPPSRAIVALDRLFAVGQR